MGSSASTDMPLTERDIKLAVIAHLEQKSLLRDGVVINELPVANWSRRADLAVANGKLQAFEIKSDFDTLRRLDGQIALFSTRFDKVVLVTTPRFVPSALERLPTFVEVWEAARRGESVSLRVIRRGQVREIRNRHILASYLQKSELATLIRANGYEVSATASRDELEELVEFLPVSRLRQHVLARLKQRYRDVQLDPLLTRAERAGLASRNLTTKSWRDRANTSNSAVSRSNRFDVFEQRFGALPDDAPVTVKARRKP